MFSSLLALALALSPAGEEGTPSSAESPPAAAFRHVGPTPPPHGYPEILSLHLSSTDISPGRSVTSSVTTSSNVGYVEARINNFNAALHRDGPGQFSLTYRVPWWLPPWLRKPYEVEFIARSVDGVETVREIGILVH